MLRYFFNLMNAVKFERLCVVLVAPRNPLNIGAAARAMSNFGFVDLRVVNPYEVAYRDAKSAVGASPVLQSSQEFATVAEAIADCAWVVGTTAVKHRQLQQPLRQRPAAPRPAVNPASSTSLAICAVTSVCSSGGII